MTSLYELERRIGHGDPCAEPDADRCTDTPSPYKDGDGTSDFRLSFEVRGSGGEEAPCRTCGGTRRVLNPHYVGNDAIAGEAPYLSCPACTRWRTVLDG